MDKQYYQKRIYNGDTSEIKLELDDFLLPFGGGFNYLMRIRRLSKDLASNKEKFIEGEVEKIVRNVLLLAAYHRDYLKFFATLNYIKYARIWEFFAGKSQIIAMLCVFSARKNAEAKRRHSMTQVVARNINRSCPIYLNMELHEISQILKENNKIAFGPRESSKKERGNYLGLHYITADVKEKTVIFTSDTMDYTMSKKMEEAMEKIFSEFGVTNYKVQFHIHKGDWHDKDVTLQLEDIEGVQDSDVMPEVIKFIQDNFYKDCEDWDFATTE